MYKFRVTDFTLDKDICVILKNIYGLGWHKVKFLLARFGLSYPFIINDLNLYHKDLLFHHLEYYVMSNAKIDRYKNLIIKKLEDLKTYRGIRHSLYLPVHGQRTRTNANTQRSKRRLLELTKKLDAKRGRIKR